MLTQRTRLMESKEVKAMLDNWLPPLLQLQLTPKLLLMYLSFAYKNTARVWVCKTQTISNKNPDFTQNTFQLFKNFTPNLVTSQFFLIKISTIRRVLLTHHITREVLDIFLGRRRAWEVVYQKALGVTFKIIQNSE